MLYTQQNQHQRNYLNVSDHVVLKIIRPKVKKISSIRVTVHFL